MSTIWSIFLVVTQVCVLTWSILSKSWQRVLKLWKLRLKQIGICKNQYHKSRDVTDLDTPALLWALSQICQHHLSKEGSGVMGDVCGFCVWRGKANALSFGRRRTKGVQRLVFSLQVCLPTLSHWAVEIMPLEQMDLLTLGKIVQVFESKHADPSNSVRHVEVLVTLSVC